LIKRWIGGGKGCRCWRNAGHKLTYGKRRDAGHEVTHEKRRDANGFLFRGLWHSKLEFSYFSAFDVSYDPQTV
jgi:hypothetical protein